MGGVYRIEIAPSSRAVCKNKECKDNGVKIEKGSFRHAVQITYPGVDGPSWAYRHWGCVTSKMIKNLNDAIEGDLEYLDGYEDLDEDLQAKVRKALEDGHVADEDWRGDPEVNRPGMNGFRSPAAKGAKKNVDAEDDDHNLSPSKPPSKKRGRGKKETGDEEVESLSKKARATSKKGEKGSVDEVDGESTFEAPPPNKVRAKGKKANTKASAEEIKGQETGAEIAPKKARELRNMVARKIKDERSEMETPSGADAENLKKARTTRKNVATRKTKEEHSEANEAEIKVPKKARTSRNKAAALKGKDEGSEAEVLGERDPEASKKTRGISKNAATKKSRDEEQIMKEAAKQTGALRRGKATKKPKDQESNANSSTNIPIKGIAEISPTPHDATHEDEIDADIDISNHSETAIETSMQERGRKIDAKRGTNGRSNRLQATPSA